MRKEAPFHYSVPTLSYLGSLTELTLGHGGSSLDGSGLVNQLGYGNNANSSLPGGYYVNTAPGKPGNHH